MRQAVLTGRYYPAVLLARALPALVSEDRQVMTTSTAFAAGSVIEVRDEEWIVSSCERGGDGWKVRCIGSSELVRAAPATFYSTLDEIEALDPATPSTAWRISNCFRDLVNIEKTNMWPWEWLASGPFPSTVAREHYVVQNDLDLLPESIDRFLEFYAARRARIERRLRHVLGVTVDERAVAAP